jgi:hypothetical protein
MTKAFEEKKTVFNNKAVMQQEKPDLEKAKYADAPFVDTDSGKKLSDVRDKFAPNADKPTTASADAQQKNLPDILKKVDPQKKAQVIPKLYEQMNQMKNVMNAGAASGGGAGAGGGQDQNPSGNATTNVIVEEAFTGALAILVKKYGFERVIEILLNALNNNGIQLIDERYRNIVTNAISNLIRLALYYGPLNIPVSQYDDTIFGDIVPDPVVSIVPDLYMKQYYTLEEDPYPGYVEWLSPDETTKIWTRKELGSYYYSTSSEEIFSLSEKAMAKDLDPYFISELGLILTAKILNDLLAKHCLRVDADVLDIALGNNAGGGQGNQNQNPAQSGGGGGGAGGMSGMMGMMQGMLGGNLKQMIGNFEQKQLPKSVLDQSKMQKTTQLYTQDMSLNNKIKTLGEKIFGDGGNENTFNNMGGQSGVLGAFQGQGFGGMGGLMGGLGGFGGQSGGGGGGIGSGVPSGGSGGDTSGGGYAGGDVSQSGVKNIGSLLTLIGIT